MAIAKFTIEMAADLGQLRRDVQNINQVVSQMGGQIAQHYKPGIDALNAVGTAHNKVADQARLSAMAQQKAARIVQQQNIQMSNQLQDFAIQVAGGQNPLLAFAQQGSQLTAVYGGVGNAVRAVAALITPMTATVAAGAVVVGVLGKAWLDATRDAAEFRKGIALTGNTVGMTADRFEESIDRINKQTGLGAGYVREMAQALVSTGRFGPSNFESAAKTASLMAQITGKSAQDVAQEFAAMSDAPAAYADKANKALHFLDAAQLKHIETLEANGNRQQAVHEVLLAMSTRYSKGVASDLSWLGKQVAEHNQIWSDLWATIKGGFSGGMASKDIQELESGLSHLNFLAKLRGYKTAGQDAGEAALERLKEDRRTRDREADEAAAKAAAETAATEKRRMDERLKSGRESVAAALNELNARRDIAKADKEIGRLQAEQARDASQNPALEAYYKEALAKQELLKLDTQRAAVQRDLGRVQGGDKPEDGLAAEQKRLQLQGRLVEIDTQRAKLQGQLQIELGATAAKQTEVDRAAAEAKDEARGSLGAYYAQLAQTRTELEFQAQLVGKAVLEQEKLAFARGISARAAQIELEWTEKATKAGLDQAEVEEGLLAIRKEQARALEAYGAIHADAYDKMYNAERGAMEGIKAYMEENAKAGENAKQAVGNVTRSMEDALTSFISTGKLDFKGFIDTVIAEFARLAVVKPLIESLMNAGAGDFISKMFSGGGGGGFGSGSAYGNQDLGAYVANGGVFSRPGVHTFAAGGAFTNQIVTHPKRFAFAGGAAMGLMGEAGPEAVVPLQRDSRGRLGVGMSGVSSAPIINIQVVNEAGGRIGADVQTKQSGDRTTVQVVLRQLQDALADDVAAGSGSLYNAIGSRFAMAQAR